MAINITRWSPDTCDCVIDYQWDDSLPNDSIVLTPVNTVNKCSAHAALATTPTAHYALLTEENPRKNNALQTILDNGSTSLSDIVGSNKVMKKGINFIFTYSGTAPNRVLTVSFTGVTLTNQQKNSAQTFLNNKFGAGKVVLT